MRTDPAETPEVRQGLLRTPIVRLASDHPVSRLLLLPVRLAPRASSERLLSGRINSTTRSVYSERSACPWEDWLVELEIGTRVRVVGDKEHGRQPWPAHPTGTVVAPPEEVLTTSGTRLTYWIEFDEPQRDETNDGPYSRSQVLEIYLEPL